MIDNTEEKTSSFNWELVTWLMVLAVALVGLQELIIFLIRHKVV